MATTNLFGTADAVAGWLGATGARWSVLNSDDGDGSYIYPGTDAPVYTTSVMENLDPAADKIIGPVLLTWKGRTAGAMNGAVYGVINDGSYAQGATPVYAGTYTQYVETFAAPPSGGTWTPTIVNALLAGVSGDMDAGEENNYFVTYRFLTAEWAPVFAGWMSFLSSVVGPVIGAALLMKDVQRLISHFNHVARGKHLIHGAEALTLYNSLRCHPARRYAF